MSSQNTVRFVRDSSAPALVRTNFAVKAAVIEWVRLSIYYSTVFVTAGEKGNSNAAVKRDSCVAAPVRIACRNAVIADYVSDLRWC